jgi:hypothetical protein
MVVLGLAVMMMCLAKREGGIRIGVGTDDDGEHAALERRHIAGPTKETQAKQQGEH